MKFSIVHASPDGSSRLERSPLRALLARLRGRAPGHSGFPRRAAARAAAAGGGGLPLAVLLATARQQLELIDRDLRAPRVGATLAAPAWMRRHESVDWTSRLDAQSDRRSRNELADWRSRHERLGGTSQLDAQADWTSRLDAQSAGRRHLDEQVDGTSRNERVDGTSRLDERIGWTSREEQNDCTSGPDAQVDGTSRLDERIGWTSREEQNDCTSGPGAQVDRTNRLDAPIDGTSLEEWIDWATLDAQVDQVNDLLRQAISALPRYAPSAAATTPTQHRDLTRPH